MTISIENWTCLRLRNSNLGYNEDQINALRMVRRYLRDIPPDSFHELKDRTMPYLRFREDVDVFQRRHLSEICSDKCFRSRASACCNREGIAAFFADVVINALYSSDNALDNLDYALSRDHAGFKCVFLAEQGCLWRLKPIVCEMFLCDHALKSLSEKGESLNHEWNLLREKERQFTWPDRPVLFDDLERIFMDAGVDSPLMYFHKGPGLLMIKAKSKKQILDTIT